MASLQTIFKSFDIDGNGFIQFKQLKQVAKKLGQKLSDKQLEQLMFGIDKNQDGKISFQQFKQWWLKGHKGKLNQLVFLKARSLKMYNFIQSQFKESGLSLENYKHSNKIDSINISVQYGEQQTQPNKYTSLQINYYDQGQQIQEKFSAIQKSNQFLDRDNFSITVILKTSQPKMLIKKLKDSLKLLVDTLGMVAHINITNVEQNDYLCVKIFEDQRNKQVVIYLKPGELVKHFMEEMWKPKEEVISKLGTQFTFRFGLKAKVNFTLEDLLKGDSENLLQTLMKGFKVDLKLEITESAFKLFKQFLSKNKSQAKDIIPLFLLKKIGLKIKLRTPQNLKKFFQKLGIEDILSTSIPNISELIQQVAPQIQQMKKSVDAGNTQDAIPFFQNIYSFFNLVSKTIDSGSQIYITKKQSILQLKIQGTGVQKVFNKLFQ